MENPIKIHDLGGPPLFIRSKHDQTCLVNSPKRNPPAKKVDSSKEPPNTASQPKCGKNGIPETRKLVEKNLQKTTHFKGFFCFVWLFQAFFVRFFSVVLLLGSTALMIETPRAQISLLQGRAKLQILWISYDLIIYTNQNELHNTN